MMNRDRAAAMQLQPIGRHKDRDLLVYPVWTGNAECLSFPKTSPSLESYFVDDFVEQLLL